MFDSFGYSIESTLSGVQTTIQMFGQGLTCIAHVQYIHNSREGLVYFSDVMGRKTVERL